GWLAPRHERDQAGERLALARQHHVAPWLELELGLAKLTESRAACDDAHQRRLLARCWSSQLNAPGMLGRWACSPTPNSHGPSTTAESKSRPRPGSQRLQARAKRESVEPTSAAYGTLKTMSASATSEACSVRKRNSSATASIRPGTSTLRASRSA